MHTPLPLTTITQIHAVELPVGGFEGGLDGGFEGGEPLEPG